MVHNSTCPECGSTDSERVHVEWFTGGLEEVRTCNDCLTQFTNFYDLFDKRSDKTGEMIQQ